MRSLVLLGHMEFIAKMPVVGMPDPVKSCLVSLKSLYEAKTFCIEQHHTNKAGNKEGTDQTAQMRILVCTYVVRTCYKVGFSRD